MATTGPLTWDRLVAIARRVGVKVVEAPSSHRGKLGSMGSVVGVTCHHTGTANSAKSTSDYPDFNVVKEGRTGLVNSLSAYGIGRNEAIYVFSEFLSWHAGAWNWKGVTDGNGHFLGIECAGVSDFTDFQRKVYPRLVAAILLEIKAPVEMAPRHADGAVPKGRKTDISNHTGNFWQGHDFYWWVSYYLANPAEININYVSEDDTDMDLNRDTFKNVNGDSITLPTYLNALEAKVDKLTKLLAAVPDAVVNGPVLVNGFGDTVSVGAVLNAVETKVTPSKEAPTV